MTLTKDRRDLVPADKLDSRYADAKGRLYFYDNAKFILIFLVVMAHAISPFANGGHSSDWTFMFIWRIINTMHMPCLIFISGFFAKKYIRPDGFINVQRPFTYMVYYVVAQFAVIAFEAFVLGYILPSSVFAPRSSLWFLVCLIWWYLLLPVVDKIDPGKMMVIAVVAGLLVGYDERVSNYLAFSRMITHFPFFLFGYYVTGDQMKKLFTKKAKCISLLVLTVCVGSILLVMDLFSETGPLNFSINSFITCDKAYLSIFKNENINPAFWFLPRLWFYLCAAGLCYSFLVWVPRRKNVFTKFGSRTLSVYIGHRLLYLAYLEYGWFTFDWVKWEWFGGKDILTLRIAMIFVSFAVTIILSLYPFYWPYEMLGRIKIKKILKKEDKT